VPARWEDVVGVQARALTVRALFFALGGGSREVNMSLLEASNFRVTARPNKPSVSVLYKPTRRRYTYTAIADGTERSEGGVLASGCCVDRGGMDFSVYDDSEIQRHARRLALAAARRIFRGS
jgi:hypothetical protein